MPTFIHGVDQTGLNHVVGPSSAVDNAIVRYDSTTGKLVQGYTSGAPTVADDGVLRLPAQPAILVNKSAATNNVTGNATAYTIIFNSEIVDQNGDFDGVSTFTAPVTGQYAIDVNLRIEGLTVASTTMQVAINTSNRFISTNYLGLPADVGATVDLHASIVADMDANDTFTVTVTVTGEASDVVDVDGAADTGPRTYMSAYLLG